jgi:hypothetical protein
LPQENLKGLLAELMEQHWEQLQGVDYCDVFKGMRIRHEQNQVGHGALRMRWPPRLLGCLLGLLASRSS